MITVVFLYVMGTLYVVGFLTFTIWLLVTTIGMIKTLIQEYAWNTSSETDRKEDTCQRENPLVSS